MLVQYFAWWQPPLNVDMALVGLLRKLQIIVLSLIAVEVLFSVYNMWLRPHKKKFSLSSYSAKKYHAGGFFLLFIYIYFLSVPLLLQQILKR